MSTLEMSKSFGTDLAQGDSKSSRNYFSPLATLRNIAHQFIDKIEMGISTLESKLDPIVIAALEERPLTKSERVLDQVFFNSRNEYVSLDSSGKPILAQEPSLKDLASAEGRRKWKEFIG